MKTHFIALIACVFLNQGCSTKVKSLGHGFKLVHRVEDVSHAKGSFEAKAQHKNLYYRSLNLGTVGAHSISPTGRYVVYENNGKLILFDVNSKQVQDVTDGRFSVPRSFVWHESENKATVSYYENRNASIIILPK